MGDGWVWEGMSKTNLGRSMVHTVDVAKGGAWDIEGIQALG